MKAHAQTSTSVLQESWTTDPAAREPRELIVDLFAGGGGASAGIFMATGRHPDIAVNHDPEAVGQHEINHPQTKHYCCDVFEVDPVEACSDEHGNLLPVALLWASPDCTHHSKARGGKPAEKKIRALAWVVVKWASKVKPRCIALENVEEFQDWGPLDEDNRPDKARKGTIFRLWVSQLEALGYQCAWRELVAADAGAPTTRKRLSFVARRDGGSLAAPVPSHAPRHKLKSPGLFDPPMAAWRSAAEDVIDWSIPCPSIFERKKPLAPKTQARIAKGIKRFVIDAARPFIVPITHVGARPNHDIDEPLKTVTSANRGELGLVETLLSGASVGVGGRAGQSPPRGLDQPVNTVTAKGDRAIAAVSLVPRYGEAPGQDPRAIGVDGPYPTVVPGGNGGDLAVAHITKFGENSIGTDPADPLHTAMAGAPRHGLVAAHLTKFRQGSSGASLEEPMPTVTANSFVKRPGCGIPLGHVEASLAPFAIGTDNHSTRASRSFDINDPLRTITSAGGHGLVAAHLGRQFGTAVGRDLTEPHPTVMTDGAGGKSYVAAATMTSYYGASVDGSRIDDPLPTVVTKDRHAPVVAFMEQANIGVVGHDAREPVSTILAAGCHQRPVECEIEPAEARATSKREQVLAFLQKHFGEPTAEEIADPAGSALARLKHGLVRIGDALWQIADIGMRMLTPRELYNAQGFPRDYIIDRTAKGPLTKTAQTRMAGNSVSPPWAAAIIAALDPLRQRRAVA